MPDHQPQPTTTAPVRKPLIPAGLQDDLPAGQAAPSPLSLYRQPTRAAVVSPATIAQLQRTIGNQAVMSLMAQREIRRTPVQPVIAREPEPSPEAEVERSAPITAPIQQASPDSLQRLSGRQLGDNLAAMEGQINALREAHAPVIAVLDWLALHDDIAGGYLRDRFGGNFDTWVATQRLADGQADALRALDNAVTAESITAYLTALGTFLGIAEEVRTSNSLYAKFLAVSSCGNNATIIAEKLMGGKPLGEWDQVISTLQGAPRTKQVRSWIFWKKTKQVKTSGILTAATTADFIAKMGTASVALFYGNFHYFTLVKSGGHYKMFQANHGKFTIAQALSRTIPDINAFLYDITHADTRQEQNLGWFGPGQAIGISRWRFEILPTT